MWRLIEIFVEFLEKFLVTSQRSVSVRSLLNVDTKVYAGADHIGQWPSNIRVYVHHLGLIKIQILIWIFVVECEILHF